MCQNILLASTVQQVLLPLGYRSSVAPTRCLIFFPFFLLICWYKEPTMTCGSCSFNFSGKFREHSPCWRPLDTQSLNMCGWEANVLQGGHSQLWECGDSHFHSLTTRSLYLVGHSPISSPRANFKLQLHPQEVILMLCQAGSSRMGSCTVGAMHLICQKAGRDSEQYSTGFHAGKPDP